MIDTIAYYTILIFFGSASFVAAGAVFAVFVIAPCYYFILGALKMAGVI